MPVSPPDKKVFNVIPGYLHSRQLPHPLQASLSPDT